MLRHLLLIAIFVTGACAPRGDLVLVPNPEAETRAIFIGSTRAEDPESGESFGVDRSETLRLARFEVAIPPERGLGELRYPLKGEKIDPNKEFTVSDGQIYETQTSFRSDLRQAFARHGGEAIVFVHGYNTNFAEGLYRFAQLSEDFDLPGVLVHYSWPSRAHVMGYAYDRDSALFARDGFEDLLRELRLSGARKILIVGHSMGSALTMETLRQLVISGDTETFSRVSGVVLVSPDIDIDVFRAQAARVGKLPQPFIVFTSQRDKALGLSARISGESERLGNLEDVERVADLRLTLIDTAAFSIEGGHFNVGDSPALIALLQATGQVAATLEGDQNTRRDLAAGVVISVENVTRIILSPISGG